MKKLNLLLMSLLISSLLIGCGMKGPLYRANETQNVKKTTLTAEKAQPEQGNTTL